MTRREQWLALLAEISAARKSGDDSARADAEWAMTRFLRGEDLELPMTTNDMPSGVERRLADASVALCKRLRVSPTGSHGLAVALALWDAYRLGTTMREDEASGSTE